MNDGRGLNTGGGDGGQERRGKMVLSGVRVLVSRQIGRIARLRRRSRPNQPETPPPFFALPSPPIMVHSYSAPFDVGKLKVSDIHTLQSVSQTLLPPHSLTHPPSRGGQQLRDFREQGRSPRCVCAVSRR